MSRLTHYRPSPAMFVACAALLISLGGVSYAAITLPPNSVGTMQLKNGAVNKKKINPKTLKGLKGNRGTQGIQGPKGSTGAKGNPGAQGSPGAKGNPGAKGDPGIPATKLWAILNPSGIVRGSGATSSTNPGTGFYTVVFDQDVSHCAYLATPGSAGGTDPPSVSPPPGDVSVSPLSGNANGVVVVRADATGALSNTAVYVAVFC
jgi:Collagen triple helix repeat (20 copies)